MRWTAHSNVLLPSLFKHVFFWPLILIRVLSTSSRSPNYLKTISANLPPCHWEMKRKLFFLFCVRFRKAERGRWGQEMTKELITEVYSYFSPVHIFRDVRTKKRKSEALHKTSKGSKSQRSCNSGWWTSYEVLLLRPTFMWHFYNGFVIDVTVHSWSLSADGLRRWKIWVLLANMYHHVADYFQRITLLYWNGVVSSCSKH